jgi:hypothetical protein
MDAKAVQPSDILVAKSVTNKGADKLLAGAGRTK